MKILTFSGGAFAENCYLVICPSTGHAVAVDPGAAAERMLPALEAEGAELKAIWLTHAHLDHVEGIPALLDPSPVPIHLHSADRGLYDAAPEQGQAFGVSAPDLPPPDESWDHGDTVTVGELSFQVRFTPGHAPGHVILRCEAEATAFTGDVIFSGSIGRTDLPGGDYRQLMTSIKEQVLTLPDETRLLTGHGPETTVERERRGNPFLTPQYGGELA